VGEPKSQEKPFSISKWLVWEAYQRVKANKGAPGVDGCSIEDFEKDLGNNLYRIWNRMSSGSYFPPPVKAVEIPKSHGGVRILGVPTVADRIAQTVVAMELEKRVEPSTPTVPCMSGTGEPRRVQRYRPCWPTSSSTMRLTCG
jgi:RNA-directed DNA polymerase